MICSMNSLYLLVPNYYQTAAIFSTQTIRILDSEDYADVQRLKILENTTPVLICANIVMQILPNILLSKIGNVIRKIDLQKR